MNRQCFWTVAVVFVGMLIHFGCMTEAGVYDASLGSSVWGDLAWMGDRLSGADAIAESAARLAWAISAFLVVSAAVVACFSTCLALRKSWKSPGPRTVAAVAVIDVLVVLLAFTALSRSSGGIGGPVVSGMLEALHRRTSLPIHLYDTVLSVLGFVVSGFVGSAMVLCLTDSPELPVIAGFMRRLDRLLLSGALLLSAGALAIAALLSWPTAPYSGMADLARTVDVAKKINDIAPSPLLREEAAADLLHRAIVVDSLRQQAQTTVLTTGVSYSVLLLCFYLPNALIMRLNARSTAEKACPGDPKGAAEQLEKYGLSSSSFNRLWTVAAAGAPVLIGFASMLTGLFGHAS